jgi:hypothetical protein
MMNIKSISRGLLALVFFLLFTHQSLFAQRFEFGGGLGFLNYKGDLNPQLNPLLTRPGVQMLFRYNFSMAVVGRANLVIGNLVGDGSMSPNVYISKVQPNTFSTPIIEFSGLCEYNFFNYRNPKNRFIFGSPYLFGGPSVFVFNTAPVEKYGAVSSVQPAVILGFGYKQQVGQFWNVGFEFGGRFTFTDYLDNVSDRDPLTGRQRGNLFDYDVYSFLGINLTYTIKEVICPFDYQQADENQK